ncbi:MAG: imidazolonepropionase [Flavobacteriales bacterium]|nr:imidazolonepropionase [Flavobacteriales bacterium]
MLTLIKNIKKLITVSKNSELKKGKEMSKVSSIDDAWLLIEKNKIKDFGSINDINRIKKIKIIKTIDAEEGMVLPCWCDSHTHIVYSGSREKEFVDRINGLSYEEIAKNGGGILNSSKLIKKTSEENLFNQSINRVHEVIKLGTGCLEIKSGYGLETDQELKMLRVIKQIKENVEIPIKSTFLGAHAIPTKYKHDSDKYVKKIISEMIPKVAEENLADYIDVFCDRGFFNPKQTERILEEGIKFGMKPKIHANELDFSGGIQVGVKMNAISVDHLEFTGEKEINALKKSKTISTLLPSTAFFLGLKYPPARKMINSNLPIALASDYNPGSSPSGNMEFIISLGCLKLKMTPEECISAATINGAHAMELQKDYGTIEIGKRANLIITKKIPSLSYIGYKFGNSVIKKVLINGKIYK